MTDRSKRSHTRAFLNFDMSCVSCSPSEVESSAGLLKNPMILDYLDISCKLQRSKSYMLQFLAEARVLYHRAIGYRGYLQ